MDKLIFNLFDRQCLLCLEQTPDTDLCQSCLGELPWISQRRCNCCGIELTSQDPICAECLHDPPPFSHTHVTFAYRFPVDQLLLAFKRGNLVAGAVICRLIRPADKYDLVIPVPLAGKRRRERGFNQAEFIGSRLIGTGPLDSQTLSRIRSTPDQKELDRQSRRRNVKGVFTTTRPVTGARILLVDDVMTTGATAREAARTLRSAGAMRVDVLVVARAMTQL